VARKQQTANRRAVAAKQRLVASGATAAGAARHIGVTGIRGIALKTSWRAIISQRQTLARRRKQRARHQKRNMAWPYAIMAAIAASVRRAEQRIIRKRIKRRISQRR